MRTGRRAARPLFRRRGFWQSVLWLLFLAAGSIFSCVFGVFAFFTAVLTAAFVGLNEFGRWSYRTNLIICTGTAVAVAVAGIFSWLEVAALFVLFFAVSAYLLYFRDRTKRLLPLLEEFAAGLALAPDYRTVIESGWEGVQEMAPDAAVFIVLADGDGGLYIPEHFGEKPRRLRRNGGTPWKVFASGKPACVGRVVTSRDQPLDRDALSLISVPIAARGEKIGVLQLEAATAGFFSEEDMAKLSLIAMLLGHELYMFETDGLPNGEDECDADD
ncbi:MAG: GAF domain-containing protein [Synergistaceae bacterium]|nr:GAF domain-containing protein [Synergistaceae bacterium]